MSLKRVLWIVAFIIAAYLVWSYFGPKVTKR